MIPASQCLQTVLLLMMSQQSPVVSLERPDEHVGMLTPAELILYRHYFV